MSLSLSVNDFLHITKILLSYGANPLCAWHIFISLKGHHWMLHFFYQISSRISILNSYFLFGKRPHTTSETFCFISSGSRPAPHFGNKFRQICYIFNKQSLPSFSKFSFSKIFPVIYGYITRVVNVHTYSVAKYPLELGSLREPDDSCSSHEVLFEM